MRVLYVCWFQLIEDSKKHIFNKWMKMKESVVPLEFVNEGNFASYSLDFWVSDNHTETNLFSLLNVTH